MSSIEQIWRVQDEMLALDTRLELEFYKLRTKLRDYDPQSSDNEEAMRIITYHSRIIMPLLELQEIQLMESDGLLELMESEFKPYAPQETRTWRENFNHILR